MCLCSVVRYYSRSSTDRTAPFKRAVPVMIANTSTTTASTSAPRITAIVCTHNRAELLRSCLDHLLLQSLAPSAYEVVVVDNASTDDTAAVVAELQARHTSRAV